MTSAIITAASFTSYVRQFENFIVSMGKDEWAVVGVVLIGVGAICMRGLGNCRI